MNSQEKQSTKNKKFYNGSIIAVGLIGVLIFAIGVGYFFVFKPYYLYIGATIIIISLILALATRRSDL
jgi:hypothetical protein